MSNPCETSLMKTYEKITSEGNNTSRSRGESTVTRCNLMIWRPIIFVLQINVMFPIMISLNCIWFSQMWKKNIHFLIKHSTKPAANFPFVYKKIVTLNKIIVYMWTFIYVYSICVYLCFMWRFFFFLYKEITGSVTSGNHTGKQTVMVNPQIWAGSWLQDRPAWPDKSASSWILPRVSSSSRCRQDVSINHTKPHCQLFI